MKFYEKQVDDFSEKKIGSNPILSNNKPVFITDTFNKSHNLSTSPISQPLSTLLCVRGFEANPCQYLSIFRDPDTFRIPSTVKRIISRLSSKAVKKISKDSAAAKEMILIFLSYFARTYFYHQKDESSVGGVAIPRAFLKQKFHDSYPRIISILKDLGILELRKHYSVGHHSNSYSLTEPYLNKGVEWYTVTTDRGKSISSREWLRAIDIAESNPIAAHLIESYPHLNIPQLDALPSIARALISKDYRTKKGKMLTWRGNHKRSYWKDADRRSFADDDIKLFEALTTKKDGKRGFMIPSPSAKAGGRVVDSFTLMPSWIRGLVEIDDTSAVEVDFSCLHPNLAVKLYAPPQERKPIRHEDIADYLNISRQEAKIENLSFFNKEVWMMQNSPLWKYYQDNFPEMLKRIVDEKYQQKHNITAKKLFTEETRIMTAVIKELSRKKIPCLYIYDAVMVAKDKADTVSSIMNKIIKKYKILTVAK